MKFILFLSVLLSCSSITQNKLTTKNGTEEIHAVEEDSTRGIASIRRSRKPRRRTSYRRKPRSTSRKSSGNQNFLFEITQSDVEVRSRRPQTSSGDFECAPGFEKVYGSPIDFTREDENSNASLHWPNSNSNPNYPYPGTHGFQQYCVEENSCKTVTCFSVAPGSLGGAIFFCADSERTAQIQEDYSDHEYNLQIEGSGTMCKWNKLKPGGVPFNIPHVWIFTNWTSASGSSN